MTVSRYSARETKNPVLESKNGVFGRKSRTEEEGSVSVSPKTGQGFKVELFSGILERKAQKGTRNNDLKKTTVFGGIQGPCRAGSPAGLPEPDRGPIWLGTLFLSLIHILYP